MAKGLPKWFRCRGYLHFDAPVTYSKAQSLVMSSRRVAKHAFYPLINYQIESVKVRKNNAGEVEKLPPKKRPIAYAAHLDSHIYAYYASMLSKKYELHVSDAGLDANVLAFRSLGKSNIEFANEAFEEIKRRDDCSVVALDISGFFDNLEHKTIKRAWCEVLGEEKLPADHYNIYKSITRFAQVNKDELYEKLEISKHNPKNGRTRICKPATFREQVRGSDLITVNTEKKGIPQGTPISALLSNIYMLNFDRWAKRIVDDCGGSYHRYWDDMLFIVPREFRDEIESAANTQISKLKLHINTKKTEIRDFWMQGGKQVCNRQLQYLGFTFDGERKLLRSAALARFSGKMKSGVRQAKKKQQKENKFRKEKGIAQEPIYRKKLYSRYSHLSNRNFVTYGHRAAKLMGSKAIKRQLKPLWGLLLAEIDKADSS